MSRHHAPVPSTVAPASVTLRVRRGLCAGAVIVVPVLGIAGCSRDTDERSPGLETTLPPASTSSSSTQAPQSSTTVPVPSSAAGGTPGLGSLPAPTATGQGNGG